MAVPMGPQSGPAYRDDMESHLCASSSIRRPYGGLVQCGWVAVKGMWLNGPTLSHGITLLGYGCYHIRREVA